MVTCDLGVYRDTNLDLFPRTLLYDMDIAPSKYISLRPLCCNCLNRRHDGTSHNMVPSTLRHCFFFFLSAAIRVGIIRFVSRSERQAATVGKNGSLWRRRGRICCALRLIYNGNNVLFGPCILSCRRQEGTKEQLQLVEYSLVSE